MSLPLLRPARASCSFNPAPTLHRTVLHIPRLPNPPKFKLKQHPHGWSRELPSGAMLVYNPPPTQASVRSTTLLPGELSPTGKRLPSGWRKVPGLGHVAPRCDGRVDGEEERPNRVVLAKEVVEEMRRLRLEDPVSNSLRSLSKRFDLPPQIVASYVGKLPKHAKQNRLEEVLRLERMSLPQAVARESRRIFKSGW